MSFISKISNNLILFLVLLVSFICINCAAPDTTTTDTSTATDTPTATDTTTPITTTDTTTTPVVREGNPFVWKISSDSTHVYLLGSVHVAEESLYPLADTIENAFEEAEYLVVEINIYDTDETKTLELILEYGTYPAGEGLSDNLPDDLYEKLEDQFAEWGISISLLDPYRPWFVENLLEITSLENLGYSAEHGLDLHFIEAAIMRDLEIVELETEEFQIELLAGVPDDVMIESIEQHLDEPVTIQDIEELFVIWATGDETAMEEYIFEGLVEEPEMRPYYKSLFTDRNYNMREKIEVFLEDNKVYFIVVGAGHLVGEEGLLNLLGEAGYSVEQLEY